MNRCIADPHGIEAHHVEGAWFPMPVPPRQIMVVFNFRKQPVKIVANALLQSSVAETALKRGPPASGEDAKIPCHSNALVIVRMSPMRAR
jgi:hypothetical protein